MKFQAKDISGRRFGRLVAVSPTDKRRHGAVVWVCICDCGKTCEVSGGALRPKHTQSCGCLRKDAHKANGARNRTHGLADSPTSSAYRSMMNRCYRPYCNGYERYGGAGVTVCERWHTFANFVADMGARPDGATIDRIDNAKGYEPGNVRWATRKEQGRNKRMNLLLSLNGETKCLSAWAEQVGISRGTISHRIKRGWSVERALTTPIRPNAGRSTYTAEERGEPYDRAALARMAEGD